MQCTFCDLNISRTIKHVHKIEKAKNRLNKAQFEWLNRSSFFSDEKQYCLYLLRKATQNHKNSYCFRLTLRQCVILIDDDSNRTVPNTISHLYSINDVKLIQFLLLDVVVLLCPRLLLLYLQNF